MASHLSTPASVLEAPSITQEFVSVQPDVGRADRRRRKVFFALGNANQPYVRPEPKPPSRRDRRRAK